MTDEPEFEPTETDLEAADEELTLGQEDPDDDQLPDADIVMVPYAEIKELPLCARPDCHAKAQSHRILGSFHFEDDLRERLETYCGRDILAEGAEQVHDLPTCSKCLKFVA